MKKRSDYRNGEKKVTRGQSEIDHMNLVVSKTAWIIGELEKNGMVELPEGLGDFMVLKGLLFKNASGFYEASPEQMRQLRGETVVTEDDKWYPGKRELTEKEKALRERDIAEKLGNKGEHGSKSKHSMIVGEVKGEAFDQQRRTNWIPPSEIEKMPQWNPVLQPVVDAVIEDSVKDVALFMNSVNKDEKEKVVEKLVGKVLKKRPGHGHELVVKRVWGSLFSLQKDQGVSNRDLIGKVIAK